jgi:hypothetical protein
MPDSTKEGADRREALAVMPVALIAALICSFWAWKLASGQFAPVPLISNPGAIVVGTYGYSADHSPIETSLTYDAASNLQDGTHYSLFFSQQGDAASPARGKSPEEIFVFLCGAARLHPSFSVGSGNSQGRRTEWQSVSEFNDAFSTGGGWTFPEQCIFTSIPLEFQPTLGSSSAFLTGYSGPPSNKTSGANIIYAWPGILSLPQPISINNSTAISPPMNGSTYTVDFTNLANDISNVVTDPGLTPTSYGLQITGSFGPGMAELDQPGDFRLSGALSDIQANGQKDLFIAGALVGVAGGGVILFLELTVKLWISVRRSSATEGAEADNIPAAGKTEGDHAQARWHKDDNESSSGLGWPG